jgi:hypothetical protein
MHDVRIVRAEWDMRPKTKTMIIEGHVMVESPDDTVEPQIADSDPINEQILLIELVIKSSNGPKKPQPIPFYFPHYTTGHEPWTTVEVVSPDSKDTSPITKLTWA